jgi:hypothetical protein
MFTAGFCTKKEEIRRGVVPSRWEQVVVVLLLLVMWPVALGRDVAGEVP